MPSLLSSAPGGSPRRVLPPTTTTCRPLPPRSARHSLCSSLRRWADARPRLGLDTVEAPPAGATLFRLPAVKQLKRCGSWKQETRWQRLASPSTVPRYTESRLDSCAQPAVCSCKSRRNSPLRNQLEKPLPALLQLGRLVSPAAMVSSPAQARTPDGTWNVLLLCRGVNSIRAPSPGCSPTIVRPA